MRQIAIIGIGQTKVLEHWDKSLKELGGEACFAAMKDAGLNKVDALFVGNMLSPIVNNQNQLGTSFSDWVGLWGHETVKRRSSLRVWSCRASSWDNGCWCR